MASIEEILGKQINSVKELKDEIKKLQDSLIGVDAESEEFKKTSEQLAAAQEELTKVTKAGKDENIAATDSIVGMERQYKNLYNTYKMMSEEQRNSNFGKQMAADLEDLSTKLNETKQGVGNFKDNIGRYAQSVTDAFSKMGVSVGALQGPLNIAKTGFSTLNKTMLASPVGWIAAAIAGLIAIFKKMKDAVAQNEELQMRYNEAMAKFQPILDAAKNGLDRLGQGFVEIVEFISNAVQKVREFAAAVTDFFGITEGKKDAIKEQQKVYDDIAKSTNQLTKNKREYQKLNAQDAAEVQRLRELASETKDAKEKRELLTQAKEIQAKIDERNIEIATEENRILEEQATLTANDAAMNDRLAQASANVANAQATAAKNARDFNKQLNSTNSSATKAGSSLKNYRQEARKLYEELIENSKTEIQKVTEKYEKEKKLLEKYHYDTRLLTKKYNEDVAKITKEHLDKELEKRNQNAAQIRNVMEAAYKVWGDEAYYRDVMESLRNLQQTAIDAFQPVGDNIAYLGKTREGLEGVLDVARKVVNVGDLLDFDKVKEAVSKVPELGPALEEIMNSEGEDEWKSFVKGFVEAAERLKIEFGIDIMDKPLFALQSFIYEKAEESGQFFVDEFFKGIEEANSIQGNTFSKLLFDKSKFDENYTAADYVKGILGNPSTFDDIFKKALGLDAKASYDNLEYELTALYTKDLNSLSATTEQKIAIYNRFYEVVEELAKRQQDLNDLSAERTMDMIENLTASIDSLGSALGTIQSSYESLYDSEVKAGKIDEKEANEKKKRLLNLQKAQTAFAIATIAADAAVGIFSVWKGYAAEVGTINPQTAAAAGPAGAALLGTLNTKSLVSAIAKTTSLATTATAQIMAATNGVITASNNLTAESAGSSSVGIAATPSLIDSSVYSYVKTVQDETDTDEINKYNLYVTVTDIEEGLGQRVKVTDESSF